jgi:hypothetical protein
LFNSGRRYRIRATLPAGAPSDDLEAWQTYGAAIQVILDEEEAERQAEPARKRRLAVLQTLFDDLKEDLDYEVDGVFPTFREFQDFPEIKPLWQPRNAVLDSEVVAKKLVVGRKVLRDFAEKMRIEAARKIVAAKQNKRPDRLSAQASDWPKSKYGASFFRRASSTFIVPNNGMITARSYPNSASLGATVMQSIVSGTSYKQMKAYEAILDAAGLDDEDTTIYDLNLLGEAFSYPEARRKTMRTQKCDWFDMVRSFLPFLLSLVSSTSANLLSSEDPPSRSARSRNQEARSGNEDQAHLHSAFRSRL